MTALEMYKKMCPHANLNFVQLDMIETEITDLDAWKETLRFWLGNGYKEQAIFKMVKYYHEHIEERSRGRWQDVGRHDEASVKCKTCYDTKLIMQNDPHGQWSFSTIEVDCPDCVATDVELTNPTRATQPTRADITLNDWTT
jgi:hypothetical protein